MKKIINGRLYNTDTAELIGSWNNGHYTSDFRYCEESLYRKKNHEYFLYGNGGAFSIYSKSCGDSYRGGEDIIPMTEEEARDWAENYLTAEKYMELFEVEE